MKKYLIHIAAYSLCLAWVVAVMSCSGDKNYDPDRSVYPIKGIDISAHNGKIDFEKVAADSIEFAYIKATEGGDFCDAFFERNYLGAKAAGLQVGAYHFFRFDTPGHMQAYHFINTLRDKPMDLPLAIDVEEWLNAEGVPVQEVVDQLASMISVLTDADYQVIIYTNRRGYSRYVAGNFPDVPLWICSLSGPPTDVEGWRIWQHSHQGRVHGIKGPVDINTFSTNEVNLR